MGSTPAQPPRRFSTRLRRLLSDPTSCRGAPLDLPFDIVYTIFEFHLINLGNFEYLHGDRILSRVYRTGLSYFAGVCRSWCAASRSAQGGYSINSLSEDFRAPPTSADDIYILGRLEGLKELLDSPFSLGESGVDSLLVHDYNWSREKNFVLKEIIARSTATLNTARLDIFSRMRHGHSYSEEGADPTCGLLEALVQAEDLDNLILRLEPFQITPGEYIQFIQAAKSLDWLSLEMGPSRQSVDYWSSPEGLVRVEALRQLSELHLAPNWHHITMLTIYCNYSSLPILAILLYSGTINDLSILEDSDAHHLPQGVHLGDFWSNLESHVGQIETFMFCQEVYPGRGKINNWLPHFTSCSSLTFQNSAINSSQPLLLLPKLKKLEVSLTNCWEEPEFEGFTLSDLLDFLRQKGDLLDELKLLIDRPDLEDYIDHAVLDLVREECFKHQVTYNLHYFTR